MSVEAITQHCCCCTVDEKPQTGHSFHDQSVAKSEKSKSKSHSNNYDELFPPPEFVQLNLEALNYLHVSAPADAD